MKIERITFAVILALVIGTALLKRCSDLDEIARLRQNNNVLIEDNGQAINLTKSEFRKVAPKFAVLLSAVRVKVKHVKQIIKFYQTDTIQVVSDTVIVLSNNETDTFNFTIFNPCFDIHGYYDGYINAEVIRHDTLSVIVDLKRSKSFLGLFRYGCWTSRGYLHSSCSGRIDSSKVFVNVNR